MKLVESIEKLLRNNTNWDRISITWVLLAEKTFVFYLNNINELQCTLYIDQKPISLQLPKQVVENWTAQLQKQQPQYANIVAKLTGQEYDFKPYLNSMYLHGETL